MKVRPWLEFGVVDVERKRLDDPLYGLKQSPRCWNTLLVNFLRSQGFKCSGADSCLFIREFEGRKLIVVVYVDDGLIVGTDSKEINQFLRELKKRFKITVGTLDSFLGIQIVRRTNGSIWIGQTAYIRRILERFHMDESNAVSIPCSSSGGGSEESLSDLVPYRQAVCSLLHLMVATRPDIAYAVGVSARAVESPTEADWLNVKRIMKYLQGTANLGLVFQADYKKGELLVFTDADYAGDMSTRCSTSGFICLYAGGAISWRSERQRSVALSTTEAEFVAACEGSKEAIWLKRLFSEISCLNKEPVLYVDSASAVKLTKNPEFHRRTKHIDVRYNFIREKFLEGELSIEHVSGEKQPADVCTKPLNRVRFQTLCSSIGLSVLSD